MRNTAEYPVTLEERLRAVQEAGERWLALGLVGGVEGFALTQVETILRAVPAEEQERILREAGQW